jgi:hypothetical protein
LPAKKTAESPVIKVCVVAAFEPLRLGLVGTIGQTHDMELVGDATGLADLVTSPAFREADVIVVDSSAVSGANRALYTQINEWLPALKVLFLGTQEDARDLTPHPHAADAVGVVQCGRDFTERAAALGAGAGGAGTRGARLF